MRLLADENLHPSTVIGLRHAGHDILAIREQARGMADREVLALAVTTQRILITRDRDFGELVFRGQLDAPPAVIYVRLHRAALEEHTAILVDFLRRDPDEYVGSFTAITNDGVRHRSLSKRD